MEKIKTALVSVSDKTGIDEFAMELSKLGVKIISTGGTAKQLMNSGVKVVEISEHTGFPEMLDGRVKTLHPKIHGGLLAVRSNEAHVKAMEEHGITGIELVVVNLYPFEKTIQKPGVSLEEVIENIDIGGPSMIRSAAKNHKFVAVVCDPGDYCSIIEELKSNGCALSDDFRFRLAVKAFNRTYRYDRVIAKYLGALPQFADKEGGAMPVDISIDMEMKQELRYGENPHQMASFYVDKSVNEPCVANAEVLGGKKLSFNNIIDLNAAWEIVCEFDKPAAIVIKHTNPCGAAFAADLATAFAKAYEGDPVSAFGCILGFNRKVDVATAEKITEPNHFVEAIIAPDYEEEAVNILTTKRKWGENLRLLKTGASANASSMDKTAFDMKKVGGGLLVQERNLEVYEDGKLEFVTNCNAPSKDIVDDLKFAFIICKHVKSNSIVLAKDGAVTGVGAGQMSRVDSAELAIKKAGDKAKGSVMASDAFFPFRDTIDLMGKAGVTAVIQPGGSKRDDEAIEAANEHGIAMAFTGIRHFKH